MRAAKIEQLYQLLLKASLVIAGQESVDHIFDASVEGRVTPVGEFHDREGVNEYFFGLAATPTIQVVAVDIKSLAASGNKVAVEVDITFAPPLLTLGSPPSPPFPVSPPPARGPSPTSSPASGS